MIYFDSQPVHALGDNEITLADGAILTGIHAPHLLTDDQDGQEIYDAKMVVIREKRNRLLTESDWTQLPDTDLTEETMLQWRRYRQTLRDLPQNLNRQNIHTVEWPERPDAVKG